MPATEEQLAICDSQAHILKIKAGAGTGKTTTLRGLAQRNPQNRILYVAFNRAIKEEAQGKFSSNVRAMTAHGLAFASVGKIYANIPDKLARTDIKPFHVQEVLRNSLNKIPDHLHNLYGGRIIETLKAFLISADPVLESLHVVRGTIGPAEKKHFTPKKMLADAQLVWDNMQDVNSPVPMIHDGYLKMFQLQDPRLGYDMVLFDEFQDTNAVTQALIEAQAGRKIYVGDQHQAIYGFRGARNAMDLVDADETHFLTGSFRFGPGIADLANLLLEAKGEEELRLRGLGQPSIIGALPPLQRHAFIARGNSSLFGRAVQALEKNERFAFVGALYNYRFDLIEQFFQFSLGNKPKDAFLASFTNYEELEKYGEDMEDKEIMGRCRLVAKYGKRIPALVNQIQKRAQIYDPRTSVDVVLTSAHRSKGLEFDDVILADDYMDFYDEENKNWKNLAAADLFTQEEVNLQYVAATRAKKRLELGEKLQKFVEYQTTQNKGDQA